MSSRLLECFDKYKCDKGSAKHRYDRVYEPALQPLRDKPISLLEIGIFKGASLAAWLDYLPNATIVGIDDFSRPETIRVERERAVCVSTDSTQPPPAEVASRKFDVIIDDGSHTLEDQRKTFANYFPLLKDDGVYFIEDVWALDRLDPNHFSWTRNRPQHFNMNEFNKLIDVIKPHKYTMHDLRLKHDPDTFVIEVRK